MTNITIIFTLVIVISLVVTLAVILPKPQLPLYYATPYNTLTTTSTIAKIIIMIIIIRVVISGLCHWHHCQCCECIGVICIPAQLCQWPFSPSASCTGAPAPGCMSLSVWLPENMQKPCLALDCSPPHCIPYITTTIITISSQPIKLAQTFPYDIIPFQPPCLFPTLSFS